MVLSDNEIWKALVSGEVKVDPLPNIETALQPASLDLRLGDVQLPFPVGKDLWVLRPGDFALASTLETISIPSYLAAQVKGRTTWARRGLLIHLTAGWVDPGFHGQLTLELKNVGDDDLVVGWRDRICSLVFYQLTSPARRPYGSQGLGSKYQGQMGPTADRQDEEE